jgi:hypothetical protein
VAGIHRLNATRSPQRSGPVLFVALLLLLISYLYTTLYLQTTNTLENNGHWTSSKAFLQRGGSEEWLMSSPRRLKPKSPEFGGPSSDFRKCSAAKTGALRNFIRFPIARASYPTFHNKGPKVFRDSASRNPNYESPPLRRQFKILKEPFQLKSLREGWNRFRVVLGTEKPRHS